MKMNLTILSVIFLLTGIFTNAQTVNWKNIGHHKHLANINIAADYGLTYGAGYAYRLSSKRPVLLNAEISFPSGENIIDDFKFKTGTQVRWWQSGNFHFASQLQGIYRKYNNGYARLQNFGIDLSATAGYYKKRWFMAGELGFDKAIITHFKHSSFYKENFPAVKDGWYEPSTGGNFYYGIKGGYSFKKYDAFLKLGKLTQQDFNSSPMLPIYAELGLNFKF